MFYLCVVMVLSYPSGLVIIYPGFILCLSLSVYFYFMFIGRLVCLFTYLLGDVVVLFIIFQCPGVLVLWCTGDVV
jgi:hypothetical protein